MPNRIDVLIVGAGPTGLTAATLLARYNVDVRIIDKNAAPAEQSKALGVQARTLELWDKLGLAAGAVRDGQPLESLHLITKRTVARGGKPFMLLGRYGRDVSPYPFLLIHEQNKTERMLLADLHRHVGPNGAYRVERCTEIVELTQHADTVQVRLRHEDQEEVVQARWLIAADGASSFVRKTLGLDFDGATYADPLFVADVDLDWPLSRDTFYAQIPRQGMLTFFPMRGDDYSDTQYRIIARIPAELDTKDQLTSEDVQRILDRHSIIDATITNTRWISKYRIHRRMTKQFRVGHIFLAGDAAHIHSPAGGQGMNTGIQDAWNLAWKLALVVRGEAHPALLDSYEPERMPVARAVLRGSDRGFSLIGSPNYLLHVVRSAILPQLTTLVSRKSAGERVFKLLSQTWINYRDSSMVDGDRSVKAARPGDRAPYAHFDAGSHTGDSIFDLLRGVDHHLLLFADDATLNGQLHTRIDALLAEYAVPIHVHVITSAQRSICSAYHVDSPTAVLVRPDGHIAWRGAPRHLDALAAYLDRLFTHCPQPATRSVEATRIHDDHVVVVAAQQDLYGK